MTAHRAAPEKSPRPASWRGRWWWKPLQAVLAVAVIYFVGRVLADCLKSVDWASLRLDPVYLALGALCLVIRHTLAALTSEVLLRAFGGGVGWGRMMVLRWASILGRYIPGKIAMIVSSTALMVHFGTRLPVALAVSFLSDALTVGLGFVVAIPLCLGEWSALSPEAVAGAAAVILVSLICLHPAVFIGACNVPLRWLKREPIATRPSNAKLFCAIGLILLRFLFLGLGAWLLCRSVGKVGFERYPLFIGATVSASIIGFLALFSPAGLGVREGIHLAVLTPVIGPEAAAINTVLLRIIETLADLVAGGVGVAALKWWFLAPGRDRSGPPSGAPGEDRPEETACSRA